MQEFLESDTIWSFLLNGIGLISLIVGFWLIFKLITFIVNLKKNKKKNYKNYINLKKLPSTFTSTIQISLNSKIEQKMEFDILDPNEKMTQNIFSGFVEEGDQVFKIDTTILKNGPYYISLKTPHQSILRKIFIKN
tara:strand:- start:127 stop:534 length:408 start_codon:yes stop_codon:yes gene_type:complete